MLRVLVQVPERAGASGEPSQRVQYQPQAHVANTVRWLHGNQYHPMSPALQCRLVQDGH